MRPYALILVPILLGLLTAAVHAQDAPRTSANGTLSIAGRPARCDNARVLLDRNLPNLGAAEPTSGLLILNPALLRRMTPTVQLFVFHHECGHHHVGGSELGADCWAAGRGLRDGWLDGKGLAEICRSFGDMPETDTHPAARHRCANLQRCASTTTVELAHEQSQSRIKTAVAPPLVAVTPAATMAEPRLVAGPRLLWTSRLAAAAK